MPKQRIVVLSASRPTLWQPWGSLKMLVNCAYEWYNGHTAVDSISAYRCLKSNIAWLDEHILNTQGNDKT